MTKTCRKCGTAFTDDLTICPVCKTAILSVQPEAQSQVTASYAALRDQLELVSLKSRLLAFFLFLMPGFLGVGWFYLGFNRRGWIHLIMAITTLSLSWFFFLDQAFLLTLGLFLVQVVIALYYVFNPDAKDARGELLK
jgi:TM2 domain-containing membrane protein YozV